MVKSSCLVQSCRRDGPDTAYTHIHAILAPHDGNSNSDRGAGS